MHRVGAQWLDRLLSGVKHERRRAFEPADLLHLFRWRCAHRPARACCALRLWLVLNCLTVYRPTCLKYAALPSSRLSDHQVSYCRREGDVALVCVLHACIAHTHAMSLRWIMRSNL